MRGTELLGPGQLGGIGVYGDDRGRAREARALDDVEPDAPTADHSNRFTGLYISTVERSTEAGHHGAAEDAGQLQRDVFVDGCDCAFVEQDLIGQRPDVGHLPDGDPIEGEARLLPLGALGHCGIQAGRRLAGGAAGACAASHDEAGHHVVADADVAHVWTDRLDNASPFVAEDHGSGAMERAIEIVIVAVAQPGGNGSHQDLATDRIVMLHVGDDELIGIVEQY